MIAVLIGSKSSEELIFLIRKAVNLAKDIYEEKILVLDFKKSADKELIEKLTDYYSIKIDILNIKNLFMAVDVLLKFSEEEKIILVTKKSEFSKLPEQLKRIKNIFILII